MIFETFQSFGPLLIPILALIIPIVAILGHYISKTSIERERHETIRTLVKAGQPVPPEMLDAQDSDFHRARREERNPNRILVPAIINMAIGLGLMGMFNAMSPGSWLWSIGLLPLFFGIGLALYWAVERKAKQPPPQP